MKTISTILFGFIYLTSFAQKDFNVYVFIAEECPISIYMAKPLREAVKQFGDTANFYAVYPSRKSTDTSAKEFLEKYQLTAFENILDPKQELTQKFEATITPEVVITFKDTEEILYRGRISNAYAAPGKMRHGARINDLLNMLTRITKGDTIVQPWAPAVGCFITQKSWF